MRKTELAYTAGIVDGEGSISIRRNKDKAYRAGFGYMISVDVANKEEWLIKWLNFAHGGSTCLHRRKARWIERNWQDYWSWQISGPQAAEFLRSILPHLNIKRPQAELAIKFQEEKEVRKSHRSFRYHPKTEEELAREEAQVIVMQGMNQRGRRA